LSEEEISHRMGLTPRHDATGDAARMMHNIAFAVSSGGMAGIAAHQSLVFG